MKAWKNIENPNTIGLINLALKQKNYTAGPTKKIYCDTKYIIERLLLHSQ